MNKYRYSFNVPYRTMAEKREADLFVSLCRKFLNKEMYEVRCRGNAVNRKANPCIANNNQSTPLKHSDRFRVYLNTKRG